MSGLLFSILDIDCPRRDDRFVHISRVRSITLYNYCKIFMYVMTLWNTFKEIQSETF